MQPGPMLSFRTPLTESTYFVGREREVDAIVDLVRRGEHILVLGGWRIGKTSLLYHLGRGHTLRARQLSPDEICTVYINCGELFESASADIFAHMHLKLRAALADERGAPGPAAPDRQQPFLALLETLRATRRHIIWQLDQFDTLAASPRLDETFFSALGALATRPRLTFVATARAASAEALAVGAMLKCVSFLTLLTPVVLRAFSYHEAAALIERIARLAPVELPPALAGALIALAGTHPALVQIAGASAIELLPQSGDVAQLAAAIEQRFAVAAALHWWALWERLTTEERRALALGDHMDADPAVAQRLAAIGLVFRDPHGRAAIAGGLRGFVERQAIDGIIQLPPLILDRRGHRVILRGQPLRLTPTEFRLLTCLIEHAGQPVAHQQLSRDVWGDAEPNTNQIKTTFKGLRRALGADGALVENIRGFGYRLRVP